MNHLQAALIGLDDERMRKEFDADALKELMESIRTKGLFHPVGIKFEGAKAVLKYGERRLRAMTQLHLDNVPFNCDGQPVPPGMIPYVKIDDALDEVELLEVELEENVKRVDLSWQEMAAARTRLFKLREMQAAERGERYTTVQLADELRRAGASAASVTQVAQHLTVARFLDDPKVRKARTLNEAAAIAKKQVEATLVEALDDIVTADPNPTRHTMIEGDCIVELAKLEPNRYDCVVTDPPYGIDIDDAGSMVTHDHHYSDGADVLDNIIDRVPCQLYRITRAQAHVYWFCDLRWYHKIAHGLEEAGFVVCPRPLIWWKRGKAMAPDMVRWPKHEYECIVFASKGDKPTLKVAGDVIATSYTSDLQQAEKPTELYQELLSRSVVAGSQVIDPFAGSGVIFDAAEKLKCSATGIELDPGRASLARIRATGEL